MKNIFLLILLTIFSAPTYSQDSVSIKVFNKLKSLKVLHKQVKFDSIKTKPLVDSLKNWAIEFNTVDFPDYCPKNGNLILDFSEVSNCFLDYNIGLCIGAIDQIALPWWNEPSEDEIVDYFVERIRDFILENSSELWYFYSDYFYLSKLEYLEFLDGNGEPFYMPDEHPIGVYLFIFRE